MSGFQTHMLIGAVGGLAAYKIVEHFAPSAIAVHFDLANATYPVPPSVIGIGCIAISAYLAIWPDIDEPGSHISNEANHFMWVFGAIIGAIFALALSRSPILFVLLPILGAVVGFVGGGVFLLVLRFVSGGHRRLTHSLVTWTGLFVAAAVLHLFRLDAFAIPVAALAWGQILHLGGDVVTPGGVPLFYPFWWRDIHFLPHPIAEFGEPIVAVAALLIGFAFLWL